MTIEVASVPSGSWGIDLSTKLEPDAIRKVVAEPLYGHQIRFVWRYCPLPGNNPAWDLDAEEMGHWLDAGPIVLLVQHCRAGSWQAFGTRGMKDGQCASAYAQSIGYPAGACIALDLESVSNTGDDVAAHCNEWSAAVRSIGYVPVVYVGFSCGLTSDELFHKLTAELYWSDAGHRTVSVRGVCCSQYPQTQLAGVNVDPDHAFVDALGGNLSGAVRAEPVTTETLVD